MLTTRPANSADLPALRDVFSAARAVMRADGNTAQWAGNYPDDAAVLRDIEGGWGYVLLAPGGSVAGYFAMIPSPEPTYACIEGGAWLEDTLPYHVVHRIGSVPEVHGVFRAIMDWCFERDPNIRIDTHRDNHIMQHCIESYGFTYCGIIYLADGAPRLAYQKLL